MSFQIVTQGKELQEKKKNIFTNMNFIHEQIKKNCLFNVKDHATLITKSQANTSINWQNPVDQLIYDIVIDHCVRSEKNGPGSLLVALNLILHSMNEETNIVKQKNYQEVVDASFTPTYEQLKSFLLTTINDEFLSSLILETINLSGMEGKIFFEISNNDTISIEKVNGFNFIVDFPIQKLFKQKDVKVLIIDGMIESVGEINHVLQKFSETKEKLLLIARGMCDDVKNTLKVNFDRETLNIFPVIVKFDFESVNTLSDIGIVCNTDVISSLKGQLISTIKIEELQTIPFVNCQGKTMTIVNDKTTKNAKIQIKKLLEKRYDSEVEFVAKLYDERIKSLTPSCVKVRIPSNEKFVEYSELFDVALRLIHSIIKRGLILKDRLPKNDIVYDHFPQMMTTEAALSSLQFSECCSKILLNTSAIIT